MWEGEDQEHWVARPPFDGSQPIKMMMMITMILILIMMFMIMIMVMIMTTNMMIMTTVMMSPLPVICYRQHRFPRLFLLFFFAKKFERSVQGNVILEEMIQAAPFLEADMLVSPGRTYSLQTIAPPICSSYGGNIGLSEAISSYLEVYGIWKCQ